MLKSKEHYDLMDQFEKDAKSPGCGFYGLRFDREQDKTLWAQGHIYQDGATNNLFLAYRMGYANGKTTERLGI